MMQPGLSESYRPPSCCGRSVSRGHRPPYAMRCWQTALGRRVNRAGGGEGFSAQLQHRVVQLLGQRLDGERDRRERAEKLPVLAQFLQKAAGNICACSLATWTALRISGLSRVRQVRATRRSSFSHASVKGCRIKMHYVYGRGRIPAGLAVFFRAKS